MLDLLHCRHSRVFRWA